MCDSNDKIPAYESIGTDQNLLEIRSEILELVKPQNTLEIIREIGATSIHTHQLVESTTN